MPAWDQQELKVHPRYQLDPSPAIVITTQFATSEESAKTSKVAVVIKLYQWQRPVFTSSAQITSSSERSPLAFAAVFINHINVNWNQFCPATPPLPQLTNQKLYFSGRYSPHPLPIPLPNTQNKPHRFPGTAHIFAFSPFPHIFLIFPCFPRTRRRADEYKYLGASHCYSLGRLSHISCKSCPPPGSPQLCRFISCPTTTRLRLS